MKIFALVHMWTRLYLKPTSVLCPGTCMYECSMSSWCTSGEARLRLNRTVHTASKTRRPLSWSPTARLPIDWRGGGDELVWTGPCDKGGSRVIYPTIASLWTDWHTDMTENFTFPQTPYTHGINTDNWNRNVYRMQRQKNLTSCRKLSGGVLFTIDDLLIDFHVKSDQNPF